MKKRIKFLPALMAMLALVLTMSLTSCGSDDEPSEVIYSYGFSAMSSSTPDFLQEMNKIESAYKTALGVSASPFTKTGSISSCDREIKEACDRANSSLSGQTWNGTYTFYVLNVNTDETVYEMTYQP